MASSDAECEITRLVRQVVVDSGADPSAFRARLLGNESVGITGPQCAVFYPAAGWASKFARHLRCGYFESRERSVRGGGAA